MVKKKAVKKKHHKVSHHNFVKHYLAFKYPIDHSHIQFKKGFIDFMLGVLLGIMIALIIF